MTTLPVHWLTPLGATFAVDGRMVMLPVGEMWDVVKTPAPLAMPVLERLLADPEDAAQLGPVLFDARRELLYWLVSPGASDDYPPHATLLTAGAWIAAPLPWGEPLRDACWLHLPQDPIVTGPAWLSAAFDGHGLFGVAA